MVDEYAEGESRTGPATEFRFLYGRWIRNLSGVAIRYKLSSDSSMVDEYTAGAARWSDTRRVQIPLWSMNTGKTFSSYPD